MTTPTSYDAARWRAFEHDGWQHVAGHYHDWLGDVTASAAPSLLDAASVRSGSRVLDVATGPGYVAHLAAERGADVVGLDFSAAMVAEASARFPGLHFREGDAENLPFPDASFDVVVCNFGLLHFGRPEQAIAEACRVLVPGGRYAFTVWDQSPDHDPKQMIRRAVQAFGDLESGGGLPAGPAADLFLDRSRCRDVMLAAGFLAPTMMQLPLVQAVPDPETYVDVVLRGAGPRMGSPVRAQPPEALNAIRAAVRDMLLTCQRDGVTELPMPAVLVSAQKPKESKPQ